MALNPRSLRDPDGVLVASGNQFFRVVAESGLPHLHAALASPAVARFRENGLLVGTKVLDPGSADVLLAQPEWRRLMPAGNVCQVLEHDAVPFPTFPYEWPAEMLHAAGQLTLDLAEALLPEGLGLKDATPYNVLFIGSRPVFVDVLSIELRRPDDPIWKPYAQFVRTFLLPLAVNRYLGMPLDQVLTMRRDGLEPEEVYRWCGWRQRLRPLMLSMVSIPVWLTPGRSTAGPSLYQEKSTGDPAKARFILGALLRRLRRALNRLTPPAGRTSTWSDYAQSCRHYSPEELEIKRRFVEETCREFRPQRVLDLGCNTGLLSEAAAAGGGAVVAVDSDPTVVGECFRRCRSTNRDILPLVSNIARPSPGLGWMNREHPSFLDRANQFFDAVLMMALVHHLLVGEGIPLEEIVALAALLTRRLLLIEYVGPEDAMFQLLTRGRQALHAGFTPERFEGAFGRSFRILRKQPIQRHRVLYLMTTVEACPNA